MRRIWLAAVMTLTSISFPSGPANANDAVSRLRFEVRVAAELAEIAGPGRLVVVLAPGGMRRGEPRHTIDTGMHSPVVIGRDVNREEWKKTISVDHSHVVFPYNRLNDIPPGRYLAQAVLRINSDWSSINAPGNLYSEPQSVEVRHDGEQPVLLTLSRRMPDETMPRDSKSIRFLKFHSKKLSEFHGRPMFLRAGILLPPDFENEGQRKYPLRVHIGGFGSRYTGIRSLAMSTSAVAAKFKFITVMLDGAGPLGDPYQVNSANHGPYGDAVVHELIPFIESEYRCVGNGSARFTDGTSTGGWVSLALQVFYPDQFNGCWSSAPDSVDFRAFELVNIYKDENVYVNRFGFERPSKRTRQGDTEFTLRHECLIENVLGFGDSWVTSGRDWGSWNAVYGPRGEDGRPVPLWDPVSGAINRQVAEHYRKYDLRLVLQENWKSLAPKLQGKIHIWVGDVDEYFLNNAVQLLRDSVRTFDPPFEGSIEIAQGKGHSNGWSDAQTLEAMHRRFLAANPASK